MRPMRQQNSTTLKTVIEELSFAPRVYYLRNLLSHEECDEMVALSQSRIAPSVTVNPETGENFQVDSRSSYGGFFHRGETPLVSSIEQRIAEILQRPIDYAEGLQILRYQIGQEYQPHFDYFDPALKSTPVVIQTGGQRVATVIMYLSNVEEGGETVLPQVNIKVKPEKGNALLFYNLLPNGSVDPLTLHGSLPVVRGEKWGSTKWIRERYF